MAARPRDFKSLASTSFATPARYAGWITQPSYSSRARKPTTRARRVSFPATHEKNRTGLPARCGCRSCRRSLRPACNDRRSMAAERAGRRIDFETAEARGPIPTQLGGIPAVVAGNHVVQHTGRQGVQVWRRETETGVGLQDAGPGAREQGCGQAGATDLVIVAIVQDDCTRAWIAIERHVGSACARERAVRQAHLPGLGCFRGARAASRTEPYVFVGPSLR